MMIIMHLCIIVTNFSFRGTNNPPQSGQRDTSFSLDNMVDVRQHLPHIILRAAVQPPSVSLMVNKLVNQAAVMNNMLLLPRQGLLAAPNSVVLSSSQHRRLIYDTK